MAGRLEQFRYYKLINSAFEKLFVEMCEDLMRLGWEPLGGVCYIDGKYTQAFGMRRGDHY